MSSEISRTDSKPQSSVNRSQEYKTCERMVYVFEKLKSALISAPILVYPSADIADGFILDKLALNCHIRTVLSQRQNGNEKVIAYRSKVLSPQEKNYCVTRRELLAVVYFIVHFKDYLIG